MATTRFDIEAKSEIPDPAKDHAPNDAVSPYRAFQAGASHGDAPTSCAGAGLGKARTNWDNSFGLILRRMTGVPMQFVVVIVASVSVS